ncbi:MAG: hypothetical protein OWT27_10900 [Firmicutes bacterium]|nr:hypothetical protein [Bacillota bacterium]
MATATSNATQIQADNDKFLITALERNEVMDQLPIPTQGRQMTITLEQVPGWARSLDVSFFVNLPITLTSAGTAPSWSQIFPYNIFETVQLSLGGGPFVNVTPYFYCLRQIATTPGFIPGALQSAQQYINSVAWNVPSAPSATAGSTVTNAIRFGVYIPLQIEEFSVKGLIPLGNAKVPAKLVFTLAADLCGTDNFLNPIVGGTGVSATIGAGSYAKVNIEYFMQSSSKNTPTPVIGRIMNVQQKVTAPSGGANGTKVTFDEPYLYDRIWTIVEDGTGTLTTSEIQSFIYSLMPSFETANFPTQDALQSYIMKMWRKYRNPLPTGVLVNDFVSGSDPANPNGTQQVDGAEYSTQNIRIALTQGTNVAQPAAIINIMECQSDVAF